MQVTVGKKQVAPKMCLISLLTEKQVEKDGLQINIIIAFNKLCLKMISFLVCVDSWRVGEWCTDPAGQDLEAWFCSQVHCVKPAALFFQEHDLKTLSPWTALGFSTPLPLWAPSPLFPQSLANVLGVN
jgi:hypothetical protein